MEKYKTVKNLPALWETWVWFRSLGWEDPLEEGMATLSSILAWRILMDRSAWHTCGRKEPDTTERRSIACEKNGVWLQEKFHFFFIPHTDVLVYMRQKNQLLSGFLISPELLRTIFPVSDVTHKLYTEE